MSKQQIADLWELWHAARFAIDDPRWYVRAQWTVRAFNKRHPSVPVSRAYLKLEEVL